MVVRVETSNPRALEAAFARLDPVLREELRRATFESAGDIVKLARQLIRAQGRGRGAASPPGEAPVSRTGRLLRSLKRRRAKGRRVVSSLAIADVFYSLPLEGGHDVVRVTRARGDRRSRYGGVKRSAARHGKAAPRPFLLTAESRLAEANFRRIERALDRVATFLDNWDFATGGAG